MNKIIIGIVAIGIMSVVGVKYFGVFDTTVEAVKKEVVAEEVPEWQTDEDAIKAAQAVIEKKEWEAELLEVQSAINTLTKRREDLEKNLGTY